MSSSGVTTKTTKSVTKVDGKVVDQQESTKVTKTGGDSAAAAKKQPESSSSKPAEAAAKQQAPAAAPASDPAAPASAKPAAKQAAPAASEAALAAPKTAAPSEPKPAAATETTKPASQIQHAKSVPDLSAAMDENTQTKVKLAANDGSCRLKRFYSVADLSGKVKSYDTVPLAYYSPLNRYHNSLLQRRPSHYTGYYWRDPTTFGWTGIDDFYYYRRRYRDPIYYGQNPYFYGSGLTTFPLANWYASLYRRHRLWEPHNIIPYYGSLYRPRVYSYPSSLYRYSWY